MSGTQALLTEYANGGSERAFRELVSSYINFVFSTALRIVGGDRPLAEDVTQAVFTDLARKAASLPKDVRLGGWLHRHTCFVARKTLRRERRRIAREKQAVELHSIEDYTEGNLAQLALVLDEAINDLAEQDRNAIVLRFFEELDFRSIGQAMGSSEDAARMRVSRAVEKMGAWLKRRGIVLTAAGISFVLSGKLASAAPTGLATRIIYVELARPAKVQGILGVLREACFTRLNVGIVSAAVILALLALLISGRHTQPKVSPNPTSQTFTPAEFADLAVEESDDQEAAPTDVAAMKVGISPAPTAAPKPAVAAAAAKLPLKVATTIVPGLVTAQPLVQPAPVAAVPTDISESGAALAGGQSSASLHPWQQRPGPSVNPRVAPRPSAPGPTVSTNSASADLVRVPPGLSAPPQPWSQTRTMATIEPGSIWPNPAVNESSIQPVRSVQPQRSLTTGRANDPRKRDRQQP